MTVTDLEDVAVQAVIVGIAGRVRMSIEGGRSDAVVAQNTAAYQASVTAWGMLYGALRGRVPLPLPTDLDAVLYASALRIAKGMHLSGVALVEMGDLTGFKEFRAWSGFLLPEMLSLNRYRKRTA